MDEKTHQLIERLAEKLGTTAEHLWGVLVRQAFISSAATAIALCIYAAVLIWGYHLVREKTKEDGDWNDHCGSIALPWGVFAIAIIAFLIILCFNFSLIVAGFLNPEYLALREITSMIH